MEILLTTQSLNEVREFNITKQELIINIKTLRFLIDKFHAQISQNVDQSLLFFRLPQAAAAFSYRNIGLSVFGYYLNAQFNPNAQLQDISNVQIPRPLVIPAAFRVVSENGVNPKVFLPGFVDPLILEIMIATGKFHHVVEAIKVVQNTALRNTLMGILKYSLLNDKEILGLLDPYIMSFKINDIVPKEAAIVFVKLKYKLAYYCVDYRFLLQLIQAV